MRDFIWPTLRAGALHARKYLLGTAMARPLIAQKQAEYALAAGADALSHGCTGKGNDQDGIAQRNADLVYEGRWWSAEREAMDALVDSLLQPATGSVRLKLYKGSLSVAGRSSSNTLYEPGPASFGASGSFDHADATGFIQLFGLPIRVAATRDMVAEATSGDGVSSSSDLAPALEQDGP